MLPDHALAALNLLPLLRSSLQSMCRRHLWTQHTPQRHPHPRHQLAQHALQVLTAALKLLPLPLLRLSLQSMCWFHLWTQHTPQRNLLTFQVGFPHAPRSCFGSP
jgi:hypothetical protein